jgi:hypothetical protein
MSYSLGVYGEADEKVVASLAKMGVDAIFMEPKKEYVENARKAGLKAYACIWVFKAPVSDPSLGVEDINGVKTLWAGSGCPNNPEIYEESLRNIRKAVAMGVDGIVLDGVRFPSMGSGLSAFLTCFCEHCYRTAEGFGYNLQAVKDRLKSFNLKTLSDFSRFFRSIFNGSVELKEWLLFRSRTITHYVSAVKNSVKDLDSKIEVGAALFTPSMARMVGQSYVELCRILDFIQPMLYHRGNGIACINYELSRLVSECFKDEGKQADALKSVYQILAYEHLSPPVTVKELNERGLPLTIIREEFLKSKALVKEAESKLTPIVFVNGMNVNGVKGIVRYVKELQPQGVIYFPYNEALDEALPKNFEGS